MNETKFAALQGDRKKVPTKVAYRPMTREEVLALSYGDHPHIILNSGRIGEVKVNGAVKRWKKEPDRAEVPVKYGMYECARLSLDEALARFVVLIPNDDSDALLAHDQLVEDRHR